MFMYLENIFKIGFKNAYYELVKFRLHPLLIRLWRNVKFYFVFKLYVVFNLVNAIEPCMYSSFLIQDRIYKIIYVHQNDSREFLLKYAY